MSGNDLSRRCQTCDRDIHDLSMLSKAQITDLLSEDSKRVCVRLQRKPDGSILYAQRTKNVFIYRKRVAQIASAFFASMIGLFTVTAPAQTYSGNYDGQGIRSSTSFGVARIEGRITDMTGSSIPGATITIITSSGKKYIKTSDSKGRFRFTSFALQGKNDISVECTGFKTFRDIFTLHTREMIEYPITLDVGDVVGVVVVKSPGMIDMRKTEISTIMRNDEP